MLAAKVSLLGIAAMQPNTRPSVLRVTRRPTSELILLEMLADEQQGNRRSNAELASAVHVTRSTFNDQLGRLAGKTPSLVVRAGRGNWQLTLDGRKHALSCI